jgi:hypothetical protein
VGSSPVVVLRDGERPSSTAEGPSGGEKEEHNGVASVMAAGSEEGALVASALRNARAILAGIYRSAPPKELQRLLERLFCGEGVYLYVH